MLNLMTALVALIWLTPVLGGVERLPIEVFTTAHGLGSNDVRQVARDSRGYLWFCTREGLSRFDGYEFVTYGVEHGLPSSVVYEFLETREGDLWLGTRGGLVRFDPLGEPTARPEPGTGRGPMFTTYATSEPGPGNSVSALLEDRNGVLWVGTWQGLHRLETGPGGPAGLVQVDIGVPESPGHLWIHELLEDPSGGLWIGAESGLYRLRADGSVDASPLPEVVGDARSLLLDREGYLWVGNSGGRLIRARMDAAAGRPADVRVYTDADGLPPGWVTFLFEASDGALWLGSTAGLVQVLRGDHIAGLRFRVYDETQGLPRQEVWGLAEGRDGSLWVATAGGGTARIASAGFTIFDPADFGADWGHTLLTTADGEMLAVGVRDSSWSLIGFTGERFEAVAALPSTTSWGWNQSVLVDRAGDWWIGSADGVFRYSGLASPSQISRAPPTAVYTTDDGLATDAVVRLFGDSRGDVWISTAWGINGLSRWRSATASFEHFTDAEGLPPLDTYFVSAFAEDRTGAVWIGFSGDGGLARWRDGAFTRFAMDAGLPPGAIRNLIVDSRGRLWAASYYGGLVRCDEPQAESPEFTVHTTAEGLSSNSVTALVEGPQGGIYIATGRGIDRLDPLTGRITRISRGDNFSQGEILAAVADRQGVLWFNAPYGLLRLQPRDAPLSASPETVLTGVRIAGNEVPVSALGQTVLEAMTLSPAQDAVEIDFVAPGWEPERAIRYQVQLHGADAGWGELSTRRSIRYASLSPGHYEFRVRAVSGEGDTGEAARFAFRILPPVWRRWWFLAAAALTLTAVAIGLHRYRVDRLLAVANLRTRIATDLHDDIGANLTRISVMSEVARRQSGENEMQTDRRLASIADLARDSIGSLAEIVWAVQPDLDRMEDLTRKLREYAEDLVQSHDIELDFTVPDLDGAHRIETDARRDLFLIFKEAIRNAVRHSGCALISVELRTGDSGLDLEVVDDGRGFDPEATVDGNGLVNMRRRAERIGARLTVESRSGHGTTVRLIRPVSRTSRRG